MNLSCIFHLIVCQLRVESTIVTEGGPKVADGDVGKVRGGVVIVAAAGVSGAAALVQPALASVKGVLVVVIVPDVSKYHNIKTVHNCQSNKKAILCSESAGFIQSVA